MSHYYNTGEGSKSNATEFKRSAFRLRSASGYVAHLPPACHQHLGDRADSLFLTLRISRKRLSSCWCTHVLLLHCWFIFIQLHTVKRRNQSFFIANELLKSRNYRFAQGRHTAASPYSHTYFHSLSKNHNWFLRIHNELELWRMHKHYVQFYDFSISEELKAQRPVKLSSAERKWSGLHDNYSFIGSLNYFIRPLQQTEDAAISESTKLIEQEQWEVITALKTSEHLCNLNSCLRLWHTDTNSYW